MSHCFLVLLICLYSSIVFCLIWNYKIFGQEHFYCVCTEFGMGGANSKKAAPELTGSIDSNKCHCFFYSVVQGINFGSRVLGTLYML